MTMSYRCFVFKAKGSVWRIKNVFPALAPDIPASFVWTAKQDLDGAKAYIDALLSGRTSASIYYEKVGLVSDIEHHVIDRPNDPTVRVLVHRLAELLLLRDHFSVPLWGKVRFITDGQRLVPIDLIAAIAAMVDPEGKYIDTKKTWRAASEKDLEAMGITKDDVTTSLYRRKEPSIKPASLQPVPLEDADDEPEIEPQQFEVSRTVGERHVDLVTCVKPGGEQPSFYARRIFTFRDNVLLWEGTSYNPDGPWKVWHRNNTRMLAEGVAEPAAL